MVEGVVRASMAKATLQLVTQLLSLKINETVLF
jgi:hypothetical protein